MKKTRYCIIVHECPKIKVHGMCGGGNVGGKLKFQPWVSTKKACGGGSRLINSTKSRGHGSDEFVADFVSNF